MPQRHREHFLDGYVLTPSFDRSLWLWPAETFARIIQQLRQVSAFDEDVVELERHLLKGTEGKLDNQGRLTLTPSLRAYAEIGAEGQVVLLGGRGRLEIWSAPVLADRPVDRDAVKRAAQKLNISI